MTHPWYAIWGCFAALLILFAIAPPAHAQECVTLEQVQDKAAEFNVRIAGAAVFDGANADMLLVVEAEGAIILHFFNKGCMTQTFVADARAKVKPTA